MSALSARSRFITPGWTWNDRRSARRTRRLLSSPERRRGTNFEIRHRCWRSSQPGTPPSANSNSPHAEAGDRGRPPPPTSRSARASTSERKTLQSCPALVARTSPFAISARTRACETPSSLAACAVVRYRSKDRGVLSTIAITIQLLIRLSSLESTLEGGRIQARLDATVASHKLFGWAWAGAPGRARGASHQTRGEARRVPVAADAGTRANVSRPTLRTPPVVGPTPQPRLT